MSWNAGWGMSRKSQLFLLSLFFTAQVCTAAATNGIETLLKDPAVKNTSVAIVIHDLDTGENLYEQNPKQIFVPASNMKLVTAAAAILKLGHSWRFRTEILIDNFDPKTGTAGNLYIRGRGDPTLSGDFYPSNREAIDTLTGEIVIHGVRTIKGNIILDDTYFPSEGYPHGWGSDDTQYCYAPRTGALAAAANCLRLTVYAQKGGKGVTVEFDPPLDGAAVKLGVRRVWRGRSGISISETSDGKFIISGRIRSGYSAEAEHPVRNPALFFGRVLEASLKRAGIAFHGKLVQAASSGGNRGNFAEVFQFNSPDIMEILKEMEHESDNFVAEQLIRTTGAESSREGTTAAGTNETMKILQRYQLATPQNLMMYDGSGLSRSNRLTPQVLMNILRTFYNSQQRENFMTALAAPGEPGTMEKRLTGTSAEGRLRAKTGALRGACALSGYYRRLNNHTAAFVMIFNGYTVHSNYIRELQDKIVKIMMEM